tara:strand:+ start:293 stop:922 length:630 start_codon:yes stop_codon:yes gene_type:complete
MKNLIIILCLCLFWVGCSSSSIYYPNYQESIQETKIKIDPITYIEEEIIRNISKTRIPPFTENEFIEEINLLKSDTTYTISNYQFVDLSSFGKGFHSFSIYIHNKKDLTQLIDDLKTCLKYMDRTNVDFEVKRGNKQNLVHGNDSYIQDYVFTLSSYSNQTKLEVSRTNILNKKEYLLGKMSKEDVEHWVEWLESINFPEKQINPFPLK